MAGGDLVALVGHRRDDRAILAVISDARAGGGHIAHRRGAQPAGKCRSEARGPSRSHPLMEAKVYVSPKSVADSFRTVGAHVPRCARGDQPRYHSGFARTRIRLAVFCGERSQLTSSARNSRAHEKVAHSSGVLIAGSRRSCDDATGFTFHVEAQGDDRLPLATAYTRSSTNFHNWPGGRSGKSATPHEGARSVAHRSTGAQLRLGGWRAKTRQALATGPSPRPRPPPTICTSSRVHRPYKARKQVIFRSKERRRARPPKSFWAMRTAEESDSCRGETV